MECDATHSLIQRKINNNKINLPNEFVKYFKDSRMSPFRLNTHHLTHPFFLDYDSLPNLYSSIRAGKIVIINILQEKNLEIPQSTRFEHWDMIRLELFTL